MLFNKIRQIYIYQKLIIIKSLIINIMKRILTILAFIAITASSYAYDVCVDGIYYNLDSDNKEAEVTYNDRWLGDYSGDVDIPEKISSNGVVYYVTSIGENAFDNSSNLTSVSIPNTVKSIGKEAFSCCWNLKSPIVIPNVTTIGESAFKYCKTTSVTLGNSLNSIGRYAFESSDITSMNIPSSLKSIDYGVFKGCTKLTSVNIPNTVTSIGGSAFENCTVLYSITLPSSTTYINGSTFKGCKSLTDVIIPNSVRYISYDAFYDCKMLTNVYCYVSDVSKLSVSSDAFEGASISTATLYVPFVAMEAYNKKQPWNEFGTIKKLDSTYELADGNYYDNALLYIFDECLSYTRTFNENLANKWSALYVPMSINVEDYLDDFDIAEIYDVCPNKDTNGDGEIDSNDANRLIVNKKKTGTTLPNTPYLIRPKEAKTYTIASADGILYPAEANSVSCSTTTAKYTFTGLYETADAVGNKQYYMTGAGILDYSPTSPVAIKPNRWIMSVESYGYGNYVSTSNAKAISISVIGEDDEATSIESLNAVRNNNNVYNLNGDKMNSENLPTGIYIKNGKKIIVK